MTDQAAGGQASALSDENVVAYLRQHPDFFTRHEDLLRDLRLPHASGAAISLVERQVHLFREQRDTLRRELKDLVAIARQNDRLFEKSKRLLMQLLEAETLSDIAMVIDDSIRNDFGLDAASLVLFADAPDAFQGQSGLRGMTLEDARDVFGSLLEAPRALCGPLRPAQLAHLFPGQDDIQSVAIIPLRRAEPIGLFAVGSRQAQYFDSSMGSLFLSYISDSLCRMLPPLLQREQVPEVAATAAETR